MVTIAVAEEKDLERVRAFYRSVRYAPQISSYDIIVFASISKKIIGAARLSKETGVLVLRGMQVAEKWQEKGIGTALLKKLDDIIKDAECFCLPHGHLEKFYGTIGFRKVKVQDIPKHLQTRIVEYAPIHPDLIAMRRYGGMNGWSRKV